MDFEWVNRALSTDPVKKRVPATCFEWHGHVVATDRSRIHIWTNPDAAAFCVSQDILVDWKVDVVFNSIESSQPEFIVDQRQDEHWVYLQILDGSWLCFNRKYYEDLKIPFSNAMPMIAANDVGRFLCFKTDNCMGALMEYII